MFAKKDAAFIVVFFLIWSQLSAQQVVSGVVFSETDASPLAGASVSVKETHTGVITDSEGRYTIQVQGASAVLVFSYAGYSVREVQVNGQSVHPPIFRTGTMLN